MSASEAQGAWLEAVAKRTGCTDTEVESILTALSIQPTPSLPPAPVLKLTSLEFTGQFAASVRKGEQFEFRHDFDEAFNVFASEANSTGKSSILETTFWALRGRPRDLNPTVRDWIRSVRLAFDIGDEPTVVEFSIQYGQPHGTLNHSRGVDSFSNEKSFVDVMNAYMMSRLGLSPAKSYNANQEAIVANTWPAYSGALYVPNTSHKVLLGEHAESGLAGRLLLMFVGVPWSITEWSADAALKDLNRQRSDIIRRAKSDAAARVAAIDEVANKRDRLAADLALLDAASAPVDVELATKQLRAAGDAVAELRAREAELAAAADAAHAALLDEQRQQLAIREGVAARRFFHGLNPSMCPRCDTPIDADRRTAEEEHDQCAVCTSDLQPESGSDSSAAEDAAMEAAIAAVEAADSQARAALEQLAPYLAEALRTEQEATRVYETAANALSTLSQRRELELQIAKLDGTLEERRAVDSAATHSTTDLDTTISVLGAARDEANARSRDARTQLFDQLNGEILQLATQFGVRHLESVAIDAAARLKVTIGGASSGFSARSPGERLRLRIATLIALVRVGDRLGARRHPGLLMIDSPGNEEAATTDVESIFGELLAVAEETSGLQIIVATARPQLLHQHVDASRIRHADTDVGGMW